VLANSVQWRRIRYCGGGTFEMSTHLLAGADLDD